jgi:hypothetical protein
MRDDYRPPRKSNAAISVPFLISRIPSAMAG